MAENRLALLIGNALFTDKERFPALRTPINDVRDVATVLQDRGGFQIVDKLIDEDYDKIRLVVEDFYLEAKRGDLTLLYYSGHGYRGRDGRLYIVAKNTIADRLFSTGIQEDFIHAVMKNSRSRHHVVILDSCFSGAFIKGTKKAGTGEPLIFSKLQGEARAILASSGSIQYSFEEKGRNSLFTHYMLEGIKTGNADENQDQKIQVDELFDYVSPRVKSDRPEQTPMIAIEGRDSEIVIAHIPKKPPKQRSARDRKIHALQQAIENSDEYVRLGAVQSLRRQLISSDDILANWAEKMLKSLAENDESTMVSSQAWDYLQEQFPERVQKIDKPVVSEPVKPTQTTDQITYGGKQVADDTVFDKVQRIIAEVLVIDPNQITPSSNFQEDLMADSLDLVELIMAMEDEMDIIMSDDDAMTIRTVGEVVHWIKQNQ